MLGRGDRQLQRLALRGGHPARRPGDQRRGDEGQAADRQPELHDRDRRHGALADPPEVRPQEGGPICKISQHILSAEGELCLTGAHAGDATLRSATASFQTCFDFDLAKHRTIRQNHVAGQGVVQKDTWPRHPPMAA